MISLNKNQECLEKILQRLTNLIVTTECDIKELDKLVNMANLTSAQLCEAEHVQMHIELMKNEIYSQFEDYKYNDEKEYEENGKN